MNDPQRPSLPSRIGAVFLGLSVPASAFGPVAMAIALGISGIAIAIDADWRSTGSGIRNAVTRSPMSYGLMTLFCVWLIASLLSIDPVKSTSTLLRMTAFLLAAYAACRYLSARPAALSLFLRSLLVGMLIVLTYIDLTLYIWPDLIDLVSMIKGRPVAWYGFFKGHGSVMAFLLFCGLWAGYREGGAWRPTGVIVALLGLLMIYGRGLEPSLAGMAGIAGGLTLAAAIAALRALPPRAARAGAAIALIGALGVLWALIQALPPIDREVDATSVPLIDMHRQYIWSFVLHQVPENPVFGVGINAVNMVLGAGANVPGMGQEFVPSHPHNWMIEVVAETGILGIAALVFCQLVFLDHVARRLDEDRWAALTAIVCFGAFWTSSLFNFSIWTSWWQIAFLISLIGPLAALTARPALAGTPAGQDFQP
ncbi:MAG: hypothetical protein RIC16_00420 [Rhodospirillales bacterium]